MFSDGADHMRLRQAITDSFARVDSHWLSQSAERVSNYLIAQFHTRGSADLLNDYAKLLPLSCSTNSSAAPRRSATGSSSVYPAFSTV